jgi:nucleoid-associated protein YgaU
LEQGQYWNNHYLAVCLAGWFSQGRTYRDDAGRTQPIPNDFTSPGAVQMQSLLALLQQLRKKYDIPVENVRGHRELAGNATTCPGSTVDPAQIRAALRAADEAESGPQPEPEIPSAVTPGEHVLLLPDTDKYFNAAMAYIWRFQPDVSFAVDEARGRWRYVTAVGNPETISDDQLARLRISGAELVQRIVGDPPAAQATLDKLAETGLRFLTQPDQPAPPPGSWRTYTVQPGDTLSLIARQIYGDAQLWPIIFEANQDILSDPGRLRPGQVLKIPPKP